MSSRTFPEFAQSIILTIESLELDYAIGGAFASIAYGVARTTADIDISLLLPQPVTQRFVDAIQELDLFLTVEDVIDAQIQDLPFNIIDAESGYKVDVFLIGSTPLEVSVMRRRRRVIYDPSSNASAMLYAPEDVIIYKLKYYQMGKSQKHLRDIAAMLIVQGEILDYDYIAHWADDVGALDLWRQILSEYQQRSSLR